MSLPVHSAVPATGPRRFVKTVCPLIGERICPAGGCANRLRRAEPGCDFALKQAMRERLRALRLDGLAWLWNLRESPDGRAWLLAFPYDACVNADLRAIVPAEDRRFLPETQEWQVHKRHSSVLSAMFVNYTDWAIAVLRRREAGQEGHGCT